MSLLRAQLPVFSPLRLSGVLAGLRGGDPRAAVAARLASEFGARRVVLTSSGTAALGLAIRLAAVARPGRPCALPAYGCFDLATALLAAGSEVIFYDISPATLQPDAASLECIWAARPASIVVVHHYGIPVDIDALRDRASPANAVVIEDAAQADGGMLRGRPLGAFGDLAVLSFGRGKGLSGGGGGALLIHHPSVLDDNVLGALPESTDSQIRSTAGVLAQWVLGRPELYGLPKSLPFLHLGETLFHEPTRPRRMSPSSARVLTDSWALVASERRTRRALAERLSRVARSSGWAAPAVHASGGMGGWLRLPVVGRPTEAARRLADSLGIAAGYPLALPHLPALATAIVVRNPTPGAELLSQTLWTVPTHGLLTERDLVALERWLVEPPSPSPSTDVP